MIRRGTVKTVIQRSGPVHASHAPFEHPHLNNLQPDVPDHRPVSRCTVQLEMLTGCGSCTSSGGCGLQLLPVNQAPLEIEAMVTSGTGVDVGDQVTVQLTEPGREWLRVVCMAYGIPTLAMIIGAVAGYWAAIWVQQPQYAEGFSVLGFCLGLTGGLIAWDRSEKSTGKCAALRESIDSAAIVGVVAKAGEFE